MLDVVHIKLHFDVLPIEKIFLKRNIVSITIIYVSDEKLKY